MPKATRLSESAVAVLRFEIRGWRSKDPGRSLPAYRELADAGIMERVPGSDTEYRFTEGLGARRDEILREEEDRIERERYDPPDASNLSEPAWELLRRRATGERVDVDARTRPLYRELVAARIMEPVSGFARGPEATFRFTYWGWNRRDQWLSVPTAARPIVSP